MSYTISIGFHSNGEEMAIVYKRGEIQESWTIQEAMDLSLMVLHTCSLIREQALVIETLEELGINQKNVGVILDRWNQKRKERMETYRDEQIYSDDNDNDQ